MSFFNIKAGKKKESLPFSLCQCRSRTLNSGKEDVQSHNKNLSPSLLAFSSINSLRYYNSKYFKCNMLYLLQSSY